MSITFLRLLETCKLNSNFQGLIRRNLQRLFKVFSSINKVCTVSLNKIYMYIYNINQIFMVS